MYLTIINIIYESKDKFPKMFILLKVFFKCDGSQKLKTFEFSNNCLTKVKQISTSKKYCQLQAKLKTNNILVFFFSFFKISNTNESFENIKL